MTFELDVAGERRTAQVERRQDGTFHVVLDGQAIDVNVQQTDLGISLVYASDGRSLDGAAIARANGEWLVHLPHVDVPVVVDGQRHARRGSGGGAAAGEQRLTAPMPGRVVRVLVAVGDEVSYRQGLIVVEAMKMENELTSPKAGRVKDVVVTEGVSVEAGRLLIVIE